MANGNKQNKKGRGVYLWALALILIGASVWGVLAKYVWQQEEEMLVQAKMFYFTSDLLTQEGAEYTLNPGTTSVTFTLKDHIDEKRYSECEIQYEVYVDGVKTDKAGKPTENSATGLLNAEHRTDEITFDVEAGKTYNVKAVGNAGYTKTLSATFTVQPLPTGFYKHLEPDTANDYFVLLTVWTENVTGDVTVDFPDGLIPDATDPHLANIQNYFDGSYQGTSTGEINFSEYNSRTYRFFKENPSRIYSVGDFTVTMDTLTGPAQPGTP